MVVKEFAEVKIESFFHFNGNDYFKQSTRTARMLKSNRVFYFSKKEYVRCLQIRLPPY